MYLRIEDAAARLAMTPEALRKRLVRGAVRKGKDIVCELGDGVVGVKFGKVWRVRFARREAACYPEGDPHGRRPGGTSPWAFDT